MPALNAAGTTLFVWMDILQASESFWHQIAAAEEPSSTTFAQLSDETTMPAAFGQIALRE